MKFEVTKLLISDLKHAISEKNEKHILEEISELHAVDVADILKELSTDEAHYLYKLCDVEKAADVLVELDEDVRRKFLASLSSKEIAEQFIYNLESDDAADILSELSEEKKSEVIALIENVEQASDIVDLLAYEEGTAGALMAKELVQVEESWTVLKCTKEMRKQAEGLEFIYTVYVIDTHKILLGTLSLKRMLMTPTKVKISDIYKSEVISVRATATDEEVSSIMEKYDLVVLPVIDELGRLIGRITIDDVVDVIKEEAEKDYQMASGISQNIESSDNVWVLSKARLPWLLIGLVGGVLGAQVIGLYDEDLMKHAELAFFIPLIAAMGGNVGVQSSAIIVQGLANNSLKTDAMFPKLIKELGVALFNGVICAMLILIYNMLFTGNMELSYTVSTSLLVVIIAAGLFGTFIPLTLNKWKIDPALATGPFITTMNDIVGLFLYFMIARGFY